jgi:Mn2+/Fe2+ NRAMP family transporter
MTSSQVVALVISPFVAVFGVFFITSRHHISRVARQLRREQKQYVGPHTQSPTLMLVGGIVFVIAAALIAVRALTGVID